MAKLVGAKIRMLRESLGLNQAELAKKLDVKQASVSRWETERGGLDAENTAKLAKLAGTTVEELLYGNLGRPKNEIMVIGAVAAGNWVETIEWDESEQYSTGITLPPKISVLPLQGFEVRGPSMNLIYPDGTVVYVAPIHSLPGAPKSGQIVLVMRQDHHGLTECTLKEYVVDGDGKKWLRPRSDSLEHQTPINYTGGDVASVKITGVVVAALVVAKI